MGSNPTAGTKCDVAGHRVQVSRDIVHVWAVVGSPRSGRGGVLGAENQPPLTHHRLRPPAMPGPSSNVAGERQQCAKQPYASWRIGVGARDSKRFESQLLRRSRKNVVNSLRRRSSNLPGNCAKSQLWLSPELGTHRASLRGGHTENWSNSTYVAQCRLRRDHCIPRATGASRYPYVWQATDLHQHRSRGLHRPPINAHPGQL